MNITHVPFEARDSDASGGSSSSQTNKQTRALWTGKERRSDLQTTMKEAFRGIYSKVHKYYTSGQSENILLVSYLK